MGHIPESNRQNNRSSLPEQFCWRNRSKHIEIRYYMCDNGVQGGAQVECEKCGDNETGGGRQANRISTEIFRPGGGQDQGCSRQKRRLSGALCGWRITLGDNGACLFNEALQTNTARCS